MRTITGTEKQIKYANDITDRKLAEVTNVLNDRNKQLAKLSKIPARWNTPEKIKEGLEKRKSINIKNNLEKSISMLEKLCKRINNITATAEDIIDYLPRFNTYEYLNDSNARYIVYTQNLKIVD